MSTITLIGAGGNIGSHLVPHLARLPEVTRLILVDPDVYEEKNLRSQAITRRDVGRPKVAVQAKRAKAVNADLEVVTHACGVEDVPLGRLRADVIVAGLDSRVSRQSVNQAAWRLGVPWVDAGVTAGGAASGGAAGLGDLLARVNVYAPAFDAPCLECAWSDADYAALEVKHACESKLAVASTNAPSYLGALAASLAAVECARLLSGDTVGSLAGRQVVLDARHHTHFVTAFRRNPRCRFDHRTWNIDRTPRTVKELRLADVIQLAGGPPVESTPAAALSSRGAEANGVTTVADAAGVGAGSTSAIRDAGGAATPGDDESPLLRHPGCSEPQPGCDVVCDDRFEELSIAMEGQRFWLQATCSRGCGVVAARSLPMLVDRVSAKGIACPTCGNAIEPRGMDLSESLRPGDLKRPQRTRTLSKLGFRDGDVLAVTRKENADERTTYLEVGVL